MLKKNKIKKFILIFFCFSFFTFFYFPLYADWYLSLPINFGKLDSSVAQLIDKKISDNKFYPEKAKKRKIEGTVAYQTIIGIDGSLVSMNLFNSSGSKILDDSAADLIKSIFPLDIQLDWNCNFLIYITYKLKEDIPSVLL